jgi:prepilin-type N-terminal cleavage/methylation domain-containing protein
MKIKANRNGGFWAAPESLATCLMAHQKGGTGRSFKNIPNLHPQNSRCSVADVDNQALNPLPDPLQPVAQSRCNAEVVKDWGAAFTLIEMLRRRPRSGRPTGSNTAFTLIEMLRRRPRSGRPTGFSAAFTLVEMLTVIAIISIVAALVVSAGKYAAQTRIKTRVEAGKRGLTTMINSYYAKFNYYPPDNGLLAGATIATYDGLAATNPLFYELTGATNSPTAQKPTLIVYNINNYTDVLASTFSSVFNRGGVANADSAEPHNFYQPGPAAKDCAPYVNKGNEVVYGLMVPAQLIAGNTNNFWHYDSSSTNRHNMSSYDLWAEFTVGSVTNTNGNW